LAFSKNEQALNLRAEPDLNSAATGTIALQTVVTVVDRRELEEPLPNGRTRPLYWFGVEAQDESGNTVRGWVSQRNVFIENRRESTTARVETGEPVRQFTMDHVNRMLADRRFGTAIGTTFLLIIIILPLQFILAITMALILQAQIKGSNLL